MGESLFFMIWIVLSDFSSVSVNVDYRFNINEVVNLSYMLNVVNELIKKGA